MWSRFMAFLVTLIFIGAGTILLLVPEGYLVSSQEILYFINKVYDDFGTRFRVICIGLGLLVLGLFNIYLYLLSLRKRSYIRIKGSKGDIRIAYKTIEGVIEKVRQDLGGIEKISTRILPGRRKVSLELRLFLGKVKNVIDISNRLQERVKEEIENIMGITNVGKVKVVVKSIAIEKEKSYEDILEEKRISRGIELQR